MKHIGITVQIDGPAVYYEILLGGPGPLIKNTMACNHATLAHATEIPTKELGCAPEVASGYLHALGRWSRA